MLLRLHLVQNVSLVEFEEALNIDNRKYTVSAGSTDLSPLVSPNLSYKSFITAPVAPVA